MGTEQKSAAQAVGTEGILGETLNCVITLTAKSCPGLENFTEEMSQMSPVPCQTFVYQVFNRG